MGGVAPRDGGWVCVRCVQAEDGMRDYKVTGVQTCALPISRLLPRHRIRAPARAPPARDRIRLRQGQGLAEGTRALPIAQRPNYRAAAAGSALRRQSALTNFHEPSDCPAARRFPGAFWRGAMVFPPFRPRGPMNIVATGRPK